jgi:hypothetical protein
MAALKCGLLRVMLKCHATLNLKFSGASANLKNRFTSTQLQVVQTALRAICLDVCGHAKFKRKIHLPK